MDALAWSYFKAVGCRRRCAPAYAALRTGTRDAKILFHAAEIRAAHGDAAGAAAIRQRAGGLQGAF